MLQAPKAFGRIVLSIVIGAGTIPVDLAAASAQPDTAQQLVVIEGVPTSCPAAVQFRDGALFKSWDAVWTKIQSDPQRAAIVQQSVARIRGLLDSDLRALQAAESSYALTKKEVGLRAVLILAGRLPSSVGDSALKVHTLTTPGQTPFHG